MNSCKILTLTELSSPFWTTFEQEALQQASILTAIPKPGEFIFQGLIPVEVLGLVLMWIAFGLTFVSANNTHYVLANCWPDKPPLMGFFSNSGLWERKGHITILVLFFTLVHTSPCNVAFIALTGNHFEVFNLHCDIGQPKRQSENAKLKTHLISYPVVWYCTCETFVVVSFSQRHIALAKENKKTDWFQIWCRGSTQYAAWHQSNH